MKAHVGVDSKLKLIHSVVAAPANAHDEKGAVAVWRWVGVAVPVPTAAHPSRALLHLADHVFDGSLDIVVR